MPIITNITLQTKNKKRCNIFINDEFYCALSYETVLKNYLKVGLEIEKEKLEQIVGENEKQEALNRAITYISKNLKTKRQVKDYLIGKGYSEEVAWYCVDKLKEYNYINDVEYSKRFIESTSKNQGNRLIEYKLMMKGVKKEDIHSAYLETDVNSNENAKSIATKYLKNKDLTKENIAKAYRYLIGKGFSYEQANYALSEFKED